VPELGGQRSTEIIDSVLCEINQLLNDTCVTYRFPANVRMAMLTSAKTRSRAYTGNVNGRIFKLL
jgi:hypothetical protein